MALTPLPANALRTKSLTRGRIGWDRHLLAIGLVLLVSLPGLIVGVVTERQSTHHMERRVVISADETWRRALGDADFEAMGPASWVIPTLAGKDRVIKPPLAVWLTRLGWTGLGGQEAGWFELMTRARAVAVAMAGVMLIGVYLLGLALGGPGMRGLWVGLIAGASVGSSLILQRWGRIAAYDIHLAGWVTLGLGLTLLGSRPGFRRAGRHPLLLAGLGGVALGCGWLSKGPIALLMMLMPLVIVLVADRVRWRRHLITLLLVVGAGAAVALPWYGYVFSRVEAAGAALIREYEADRPEASPPWTYLSLIGLMLPWTVWMVGGLLRPAAPRIGGDRLQRSWWIAWWWLVLLVVIMSLPEAKQQRYILPVLPAAGLLVGLAAVHLRKLRSGWASWLGPVHGLVVFGMSLVVYAFVILNLWDAALPQSAGYRLVILGWGLAMVLVGSWTAAACWSRTGLTTLIGVRRTMIWAGLILPLYWAIYLPVDDGPEPTIDSGVRVRELAGQQPIAWLDLDASSGDPDEKMMLSLRRLIPEIDPASLADRSGVIVARDNEAHAERLMQAGFQMISDPIPDRGLPVRVWARTDDPTR